MVFGQRVIDLNKVWGDMRVLGDDTDDMSGQPIAYGDINGDGYDDVIIGAVGAAPGGRTGAGETYVIFGSATPPTTIDLDTQSADITVYGDDNKDYSGRTVASGDVNGDGYDDVIIGAYYADPDARSKAGETYVIFGSSSPSSTYDLSTTPADITIYGDDADDISGYAVSSGDVNGDGYHDIIIGALYADPGGRNWAGETYLISGGGAIIAAHGLGGTSQIREFSLLGRKWSEFRAFGAPNAQGEVHLAVGDIDGDGFDEIAAGQGEGGNSYVKLLEMDGTFIRRIKAFGTDNPGGEVHLAIGNFDANPSDKEIAVAHGEGGQSYVKLFRADGSRIRKFTAFGPPNAQGEVHLAAGDLYNSGVDKIIAGMGEGGSSLVKIFNHMGTFIRKFTAFGPAGNPGGEVHVAVGNFDADADLEIAVATGYNGGNWVKLFENDGTSIRRFIAFGPPNANGEVHLATADLDNDGVDEIIAGMGEGGSSVVRVFKADGTRIRSFTAFGGANSQGEVHLGKSNY